jgi:hypothetical protein
VTDDFREGRVFEHRYFCIGWQGAYFVFLIIYVFPEEQWHFVTDCTTETGLLLSCTCLAQNNVFIYSFIVLTGMLVIILFMKHVFCMWPISHALWVPTFYGVQLLKPAACHTFSHFSKAVLFLVRCSIICV